MPIGIITQQPNPPMVRPWDEQKPCSRADELEERDIHRKYRDELRRCEMRRMRPGFERIDNMRYKG